ncbi:MAG: hypothetical protein RL653_874 [Pseudomonadota bacterium]|jgi:hypothetical protein
MNTSRLSVSILALAALVSSCTDKHLSAGRDYLLAGELATASTEFKASVATNENSVPARGALLATLVLQPRSNLDVSVFLESAPYQEMLRQKDVPETTRERLTQGIMKVRKSLQDSGIRTQDNEDALKVVAAAAKEFDAIVARDWMKQRRDYRAVMLSAGCMVANEGILEQGSRAVLAEKGDVKLSREELVLARFLGPAFFKKIAASADNREATDHERAVNFYRLQHALDIARRVFEMKPGPGPRNLPGMDAYGQSGARELARGLVQGATVPYGLVTVGSSSEDPDERTASVFFPRSFPSKGPQLVMATIHPDETQELNRAWAVEGSSLSEVKVVVKRDGKEQAQDGNLLPGSAAMFGHGYHEASGTWNLVYWDADMAVLRVAVGTLKDGVLTLTPDMDVYARLGISNDVEVLRAVGMTKQAMFDVRSRERAREQLDELFRAASEARLDLHSRASSCYSADNLASSTRPSECSGGEPVPADSQYLAARKRKNQVQPAVGMKLRVTGNSNNHNYRVGDVVTVTDIDKRDGTVRALGGSGRKGNWLAPEDWERADRPSRRFSTAPSEGTSVRVVRNSNGHNYTVGALYEVSTSLSDQMFRARNDAGVEGTVLLLRDVEPANGTWGGPYLSASAVKDPWGTPYRVGLQPETGRLVVASCGPDRACAGDLPSLVSGTSGTLAPDQVTAAVNMGPDNDDIRVVETNGPVAAEYVAYDPSEGD